MKETKRMARVGESALAAAALALTMAAVTLTTFGAAPAPARSGSTSSAGLTVGQQISVGGRPYTVETVNGNRVVLVAGGAARVDGGTTATVAAGAKLGNVAIPVSVTPSSAQATQARRLIDGSGLQKTADGSGVFVHTTDKYVGGGTMWNADYINGVGDLNATLLFDMGQEITATGVHMWNYNEQVANFSGLGRGVRDAEILAGSTPNALTSIGTYTFPKATGENDAGADVLFKTPAKARYFKFVVKSTW